MPIYLEHREPELVEHMDRRDCDPEMLANTYRQFYRINRMLSKWRKIYKKHLRPMMNDRSRSYSLLDIGFGGGDIVYSLSKWAAKDGIDLRITGIETDPRAIGFVKQRSFPPGIHFRHIDSAALVDEGATYDFVISNHVLHHLDKDRITSVLQDAKNLARLKVVFNDIERSDLGYFLFNILSRPLFRNSFITEDGLISIRKSFTFRELSRVKPSGWEVHRLFPFRLLLVYQDYARIS